MFICFFPEVGIIKINNQRYLGGFTALIHLLNAVVASITLVGIPYGISQFQMAVFCAYPFGYEVVETEENTTASLMSLFFFPLNIVSFLAHMMYAGFDACTIVGSVFAEQHLRLALLSFSVSRKVIPYSSVVNPQIVQLEPDRSTILSKELNLS